MHSCKENIETITKFRRCLPQFVAVSVKNVLLLVYGLTMGMPTMLIPSLSNPANGEKIVLDEDGISWLGSLNYLSVPLGCLLSGITTKPLGRIRSMQIICVLFSGAFLIYHFASEAWHVFLALFLTGFTGGLLEAPTLIYTVEITEPHLRGSMSSSSTIAIALGVMTAFILGTTFHWRTMALINGCVPLIGLILLAFIPESPYWLVSKHQQEKAKKNLAWLRGWTDVGCIEAEFQDILNTLRKEEIAKKEYLKPTFYKPYILICFTFVLAYSGTVQINIYAVKLFQLLRVNINSYYATIVIGVVELLGSILLMILVKRLGKRTLSFISQTGICLGFIIVGIYAYKIHAINFDATLSFVDEEIAAEYNLVALLSVIIIAFFSYLMTFTLPWIIMGELYPNNIRDAASGMSAGTGYIIAFVSNKTFLSLANSITLAGVFWLYSLIGLIGMAVLYVFLPETEGKTLFEITEHYAGRGRIGNKIERVQFGKNENGTRNEAFENSDEQIKNTAV